MKPSKLAARESGACDPAVDNSASEDDADYLAATRWLYDRIDYERLARSGSRYRFTLDRMRELVTRLGHGRYLSVPPHATNQQLERSFPHSGNAPVAVGSEPAAKAKIVHIAGTKGKGSVATMTATMLVAAGYRVGLYTSPHLVHLEERFRINGHSATRREMTALVDSMRPFVDEMSSDGSGGPSFFELTTAIAIEHFHRGECDYWVLETGLGGRLDSTNVFQSDVTMITSIGLDHQHVLGDTLELIAKEKAGILKPGIPAISGVTNSPARDVIRQTAAEVGAPLLELGRDFSVRECVTQRDRLTAANAAEEPVAATWGSTFELVHTLPTRNRQRLVTPVRLALEGRHQIGNAAVALVGLEQLGLPSDFLTVPRYGDTVLDALSRLQIDARLERLTMLSGTTVILDAAHNPDSITALIDTLTHRFAGRRVVGVFGTSVDKDAATMLSLLRNCLDAIVLTRYHGNPRFVRTALLADLAIQASVEIQRPTPVAWFTTNDDPTGACQAAMELAGDDGVVVVCGSFFLAAEVRLWLLSQTM